MVFLWSVEYRLKKNFVQGMTVYDCKSFFVIRHAFFLFEEIRKAQSVRFYVIMCYCWVLGGARMGPRLRSTGLVSLLACFNYELTLASVLSAQVSFGVRTST